MSARFASERGAVLVAALFLAAGVALFASALFGITYLDGTSSANHLAGESAFFAAEAGIEHVLAIVPPAPDFTAQIGWRGGSPPFGAVVDFPAAPTSYRVSVTDVTPERLTVRSRGTAERGAERTIEAHICREATFSPAAPLVLASPVPSGIVGGTAILDGTDLDGRTAAVAPLAIESASDLEAAERLAGRRPIELSARSGLAAAAAALAGGADRTETGPLTNATLGSAAAPAVTRIVGNGEMLGTSTATGIVVAESPLRIRGRLDVSGILLATAGIAIEGELVVAGLVWTAGGVDLPPGALLDARPSSAALDAADRLRPAILPREAVLCGWREVW